MEVPQSEHRATAGLPHGIASALPLEPYSIWQATLSSISKGMTSLSASISLCSRTSSISFCHSWYARRASDKRRTCSMNAVDDLVDLFTASVYVSIVGVCVSRPSFFFHTRVSDEELEMLVHRR